MSTIEFVTSQQDLALFGETSRSHQIRVSCTYGTIFSGQFSHLVEAEEFLAKQSVPLLFGLDMKLSSSLRDQFSRESNWSSKKLRRASKGKEEGTQVPGTLSLGISETKRGILYMFEP